MKNILRIFKYDLKKIHKNVIAMIVIMGITVIPTLYAWFNIAASWDPYGNTGNLKVAVASSDEGYSGELLSVNLNLGDQVLTTLRGNSQLDWTFTSAKKAKEGVKSGKYYAAIVIPKDFSKDMMSIFTSNVTHPEIKYYINEKDNAIAPKVTVKGANAVQQQINDTFVQTVSQTALEAFQLVNNVADETDEQTIADNLSAADFNRLILCRRHCTGIFRYGKFCGNYVEYHYRILKSVRFRYKSQCKCSGRGWKWY